MGYRAESIKEIKIRVFKWTQNMIKNHVCDHPRQICSSSKFGLLVLRVKNQTKIIRPRNCCSKNRGGQTKKTTFKKNVQPFKLVESSEELIKSIEQALGLSSLFFKETIPHLAKTISCYLRSSFEYFDENFSLLQNMSELSKIVVAIDMNMQSGSFEIGSESSNDVCSFQLTDLYETLLNEDGHKSKEKVDAVYLQVVDGVQVFSEVKKRRVYTEEEMVRIAKIVELEVEYTFTDSDTQDILDTLLNFLITKTEFVNETRVLDGEIQEFRNVKGGLKIVMLD